jgi:hypothetical protein
MSWMRVPRSRKAAVERRWRRTRVESKTHTEWHAGARRIDFVWLSQKAPSGRFTRRRLNLNSHNHNRRDRRPGFSLAVLIEHLSSTLRYDISLRRNRASNIRGPAVPPRVDRWPMPRLVTAEPSCARCRECAWSAMQTTIGRHGSHHPMHDLPILGCWFHV